MNILGWDGYVNLELNISPAGRVSEFGDRSLGRVNIHERPCDKDARHVCEAQIK